MKHAAEIIIINKRGYRVALFLLIGILLFVLSCTPGEAIYTNINNDSLDVAITADDPLDTRLMYDDDNYISMDAATHALTVIDYEHHEIHGGSSYSCWYEQSVSDTGDKSIIALITPDTTKWLHLIIVVQSTAAAKASLYEAPTITDDAGDNVTVYNRDRNSSSTSNIINTSTNPDSTGNAMYFTELSSGNVTGGTEIAHSHIAAAEGKKALGGENRGSQEWILKQNTAYAIVIESLNDDDNTHTIELDWYEHTNRG